jgi:radical SAM superfamily enzyme YgiQ (UPF0313 family)
LSAVRSGLRERGATLVVSCYELGRQPVAAATALAELASAGFEPAALDVAVDPIDDGALRAARLIAISVPMHTALRLGVRVAHRARAVNPSAHVCLFGLYAALNRAHLLERHCDSIAGGEADEPLRLLAEQLDLSAPAARFEEPIPGIATRQHPELTAPRKSARKPSLPVRSSLPALDRYARLEGGAEAGAGKLVAAVEATRGCLHLCRHCPIVPVYRGRFVAVPRETVLADIEQQVHAGAEHVTFGDPDFLNGPTHAVRLVQELHSRWPGLTFDATIKIEHLLRHRALLPELAAAGCLFITSAVESLNDRVLGALDKGHTAADVPIALRLVRGAGIDLRPTLLPYTPWTELSDLPALFDFAEEHNLDEQIEPVQYTLRLLIPPGSAVLEMPGEKPWLREERPDQFGWAWRHPDARVDALWEESSALAQAHAQAGRDPRETLSELRAVAARAAGISRAPPKRAPRQRRGIPRLTEPWFC